MNNPAALRGEKVILVALFSLRQRDRAALMEALANRVAAHGGEVVAQVIQLKGVSRGPIRGPGGVRRMQSPSQALSSSTFIGTGKAREVGETRERTGATLIITFNSLSRTQQERLEAVVGAPVRSAESLFIASRAKVQEVLRVPTPMGGPDTCPQTAGGSRPARRATT